MADQPPLGCINGVCRKRGDLYYDKKVPVNVYGHVTCIMRWYCRNYDFWFCFTVPFYLRSSKNFMNAC